MRVKAVTDCTGLEIANKDAFAWGPQLHAFVTAAVLAGAVALVALGALRFTGHVVQIDRSESMASHAGDLLITRVVPARSVRPGDVVTFADPTRAGRKMTHRVVSVSGERELEFLTRGNAHRGIEKWTIAADGTVGRLQAVLPSAGRAIAWLGGPGGRIVLVVLPLLYLGSIARRRIWA
jgi:signal peptidase I